VNGELRKAKEPLTAHGFNDASTNAQCIDDWYRERPDALVGVPTGPVNKLFVVDIDPEGADWYRENAKQLGCGRVHKTRRGWHLLYRMPAIELRNTTGLLARGVDTRGTGGYIIWWPAHGLDVTGGLEDLTEPPAWLIERLKSPKAQRASQHAANGKTKYGEGERHGALVKFASSLRHKGLRGAALEGALLGWNIENCHPPQDEAEVRRIARDYDGKPEDPELAHALDEIGNTRFRNFQELATTEAEGNRALIEGLIYPGAWLLTGRPKIGKSWLQLQMALALAEIGTFLGYACSPMLAGRDVLCVFAEDNDARIKGRLAALGVARPPRNCHLINQQELKDLAKRFADKLSWIEFLETWYDAHPKVIATFIDTEVTVRQVWNGERDDAAPMVTLSDYRQTREYDEPALRRGMFIALTNHARKRVGEWIDIHELINRSNTALAGCSGSIALADPPDCDPLDPKHKARVLGIRGRDLRDDIMLSVRQQPDLPMFVSEGPYLEVTQTKAEEELLRALEAAQPAEGESKLMTSGDLADLVGKSQVAVKRTISRMAAAKRTTWKTYRVIIKPGKNGGLRLEPI
jgi:hypothetical protein